MTQKATIPTLEHARGMLIDYLYSKIAAEDFHAVQDAASDIREIDAKLSVLREQNRPERTED
jgi:hypothetical protein